MPGPATPTYEQVHRLADKFGLHSRTIDDARAFSQRPKIEEYAATAAR